MTLKQLQLLCFRCNVNDVLHPPTKLHENDEDDKNYCDIEKSCDIHRLHITNSTTTHDSVLQDSRKSSFIVQSTNGRAKCQSSEKGNGRCTSETCIWSSIYFAERENRCGVKHTCASKLDKKLTCRSCVLHDRTDASALMDNPELHYFTLKADYRWKMSRDLFHRGLRMYINGNGDSTLWRLVFKQETLKQNSEVIYVYKECKRRKEKQRNRWIDRWLMRVLRLQNKFVSLQWNFRLA